MYTLCLQCYEVFMQRKLSDIPQCPKVTCATGKLIQVDELLIPAIITLNKKGYKTEICCSTHIFGPIPHSLDYKPYGSSEIYIHFESGTPITNPPEGFEVELLMPDDTVRLSEKPYDLEKLTVPERQRHTFNNIANLTEWAESLPVLYNKDRKVISYGKNKKIIIDERNGKIISAEE